MSGVGTVEQCTTTAIVKTSDGDLGWGRVPVLVYPEMAYCVRREWPGYTYNPYMRANILKVGDVVYFGEMCMPDGRLVQVAVPQTDYWTQLNENEGRRLCYVFGFASMVLAPLSQG